MKKNSAPEKKKNYHKPELTLYGDIHQLTQASSLTGRKADGYKIPGDMGPPTIYKTG